MTKSKITKEQVEKVAKLSKLELKGEEEMFAGLFTDTLEKIEILKELDTKNVSETFQVTGLTNIFQKNDENKASLTQAEALSSGKEVSNGLFVTKGVFDRE